MAERHCQVQSKSGIRGKRTSERKNFARAKKVLLTNIIFFGKANWPAQKKLVLYGNPKTTLWL